MKTITGGLQAQLVFAAVVELGSFTAAAVRLGCSKAHASKQVSAIEAELGVQLLHRTTRRLHLTDAGRVYADYCRQLRDTLEEANRAVSALRTEVAGTIRVTAPPALGHRFLPELIMAFRDAYPSTRIEADLDVANRDLIGDDFDAAIRTASAVAEHLVVRPLGLIRDVVVASPRFLEQHGRPDEPGELASLPCIVNGHLRDDAYWTFQCGDEVITVCVDGPVRINQHAAIERMARAGAGVARLPAYLVAEAVAGGELELLCPGYELVATEAFLLYPQRRVQPLRCRVFVDFVQRWFADPARASLLRAATGP